MQLPFHNTSPLQTHPNMPHTSSLLPIALPQHHLNIMHIPREIIKDVVHTAGALHLNRLHQVDRVEECLHSLL